MAAENEDSWQWLEDVEAEKSLAWVRDLNAKSTAEIEKIKGFKALESQILAILDSKDKIPYVGEMGGFYYNFWQDADHEKGIWRRTTLEEYKKEAPNWELVLDVDALAKADGKSWVWHGSSCLPPEYQRCLVTLSPGGSDADVVREFDLATKTFVEGGFYLPESKGDAGWIDADTLYVGRDMGPGSMTTSGYPRQVRRWTRGTPLAEAPVVYEGPEADVGVSGFKDHTKGFEREWIHRSITFWSSEQFLLIDGTWTKLEKPDDAQAYSHKDWLLFELRSDWEVGGRTWPSGSLIVTSLEGYLKGERKFEALFAPTERSALSGVSFTQNRVVVNELENVRNKLYIWENKDGSWSRQPMAGLPDFGTVGVSAVDDETSDDVWITVTDYLTPTTLSLGNTVSGVPPVKLKSLPSFFETKGLEISQHQAKSTDGTLIPYFQVAKKGVKKNGKNPTLLYGYGGFEVPMVPGYSAGIGSAWLEKGGIYVVANIRGGGEFGPRWHQAALKANRHKAYEDFAAVADDLVARKLTSPAHLGAMGGSNGGLLMGNMVTQYPEKFGAIVCQVPLLDMRRYHKLLAGASWMGEYGDPDNAEEWKFIEGFSPYHNLKKDTKYPRTLFTTSTKDDRVHPGHARKMVARMLEQGHDVLYWENIEGGHGGAANNAQRAYMTALSWSFLWNELK